MGIKLKLLVYDDGEVEINPKHYVYPNGQQNVSATCKRLRVLSVDFRSILSKILNLIKRNYLHSRLSKAFEYDTSRTLQGIKLKPLGHVEGTMIAARSASTPQKTKDYADFYYICLNNILYAHLSKVLN